MKIDTVINFLEEVAPLSLQEDYDNSGLLVGNKEKRLTSALITLDCTEKVVQEAIKKKCNLIISHHPIIFHPLKRLTPDTDVERAVIRAIKNNIAIYTAHTNLDNVKNGVNKKIADVIGLTNLQILSPKENLLRQLVVFCPKEATENVRDSLFKAGAGYVGKYDRCSFTSEGKGTFRASKECNPYAGKIQKIHLENEDRIEVVFPKNLEANIISEMRKTHPYEEVAYQIYSLENVFHDVGAGMFGDLPQPIDSKIFLKRLKKSMKTDCLKYTDLVKKQIKRVAICGGSGSFLIKKARDACADIFISSDFKYHEFFDSSDMMIVDIGHYESEQFTKELIHDLLSKKFSNFAFLLSKINTNPINYL